MLTYKSPFYAAICHTSKKLTGAKRTSLRMLAQPARGACELNYRRVKMIRRERELGRGRYLEAKKQRPLIAKSAWLRRSRAAAKSCAIAAR
jgi:hypothetical protein